MTPKFAASLVLWMTLNGPMPLRIDTGQKPINRSATAEQAAHKNQSYASHPTPFAISVLYQFPDPDRYEEPANVSDEKNNESQTNRLLMIFTGALASVALLQFGLFIYQISTERSVRRKELRAYLLPSSGSRQMKDGSLKLETVFINSGKTPALNCKTRCVEGVAAINNTNFPIPDDLTKRRSRSFVGADAPLYILEDASMPTPQQVIWINNGTHAVYLAGDITYADVFGKQHVTRFRLISEGTNFTAGIFVFCEEGNEIT